MALTEQNLIALNFKEASSIAVIKETKPKAPRKPAKMSEEQRNKRIAEYQDYWTGFINDYDAEIYAKLEKIAKKQYSKDEELANFEEQFYQNFIMNDECYNKKINRYYSNKGHQRLVNLRNLAENK